jgi:hypothetical protein
MARPATPASVILLASVLQFQGVAIAAQSPNPRVSNAYRVCQSHGFNPGTQAFLTCLPWAQDLLASGDPDAQGRAGEGDARGTANMASPAQGVPGTDTRSGGLAASSDNVSSSVSSSGAERVCREHGIAPSDPSFRACVTWAGELTPPKYVNIPPTQQVASPTTLTPPSPSPPAKRPFPWGELFMGALVVGAAVLAAQAGAGAGGSYSPTVDWDWRWDLIDTGYGRGWVCRGVQTGKFGFEYQCFGKPRVDSTWPGT